MERLLYYIWRHRLFDPSPLTTTDGELVEVIDPGVQNIDAGPDFLNAKVRIGSEEWVGNVEIHTVSSDWDRHRHAADRAYDSVILHVVGRADCEAYTGCGRRLPQLEIAIPEALEDSYQELMQADGCPACHRHAVRLSPYVMRGWLDALCIERLEGKTDRILQWLRGCGGDWEQAFFINVARSFGFGINGDVFEHWARTISLADARKCRDNAFQIEAMFMGQAGLLDEAFVPEYHRAAAAADGYLARLRKEYEFLQARFGLRAINGHEWRFLRTRPQNFPHIRLSQLAQLFCDGRLDMAAVVSAGRIDDLRPLLAVRVSDYWTTHYGFGGESGRSDKSLSASSVTLLVINAVVPVLFAYGRYRSQESLCDKAVSLLSSLRPENNRYVRPWVDAGLPVRSAADSQALIQLRTAYCQRHDCLRCRFGYEYLCHTHVYRPDDFLREVGKGEGHSE